jgi:hypothetical protein
MSEYRVRVELEESRIDSDEYAALPTLISSRGFQMYVVHPPSKTVSALLQRRMDLPNLTCFGNSIRQDRR